MKKHNSIVFLSIIVAQLFFSCNKKKEVSPNSIFITPSTVTPSSEVSPSNPNSISSILVFPGATIVDSIALPTSSVTGAPVISNFDKNVSYAAGSKIIIPLDVSASTAITGVYVQVKGASTYFDIPINTSTSVGTVSFPFDLSSLVGEGTFIIILKFYDANKNTSASCEVSITVTKPANCGITRVSGGQGLTSNLFKVPNIAGKIKIGYETFTVKDKIDVFQSGNWIAGTGPVTDRNTLRKALNCTEATEIKGYVGKKSEFLFDYNPVFGTDIEVVVSGCEDGGTKWEYTFSCPGDVKEPVINTLSISAIGQNTATSGGTISSDGGSVITGRGVVWSTSPNPVISLNNKTSDGSDIGTFESLITGLSANTKYFLRSYATNSLSTTYGNEVSFTTSGTSINLNLNGNWLTSGGTGITISNTTGVFYSFSNNYQIAANGGFISIGGLKIKNIININSTKWSCLDLYLTTTNGVINGKKWSTDGTITMSSDGKSITVVSTGPVSGNVGSTTYARVN